MKKECKDGIIEDILQEWVEISLEHVKNSEQLDKIKELKLKFLRNKAIAGNVVLSDYSYSFAEIILKTVSFFMLTNHVFSLTFVMKMIILFIAVWAQR